MNSQDSQPPDADATPDIPSERPALPAQAPLVNPRPPADRGRLWGWLVALLGCLVPFLVMATDRQFGFSVPLALVTLSAAAWGLMRGLGAWPEEPAAQAAASATRTWLQLLFSVALFIGVTQLAVRGVYPLHKVTSGALVTGTFLWCVVCAFRAARSLGFYGPDEDGTELPLWERHGFWLIALSALFYLPFLGNFGLIDPWETHYGEVAREMLARDDWVSLWWAHDGWFWSKPILNFWMHGLSFKLFGVNPMPDQMLQGVGRGLWPQPEWACRLPVFFMTVVGAYVLYRSTLRPFGRRAAFLGGLVLMTCPYWYILARQTMADMPYVAPLCAAMGLLWLGFQTDPEERAVSRTLQLGRWRLSVSGFHLLFGAIVLCALPQILYLFSRNLTLHTTDLFGFRLHLDELSRGSGGGNCGQPGNKSCAPAAVTYAWGQPFACALVWLTLLLGLLFYQRRERRLQRLYFIGGWLFTAVAVMGKGAPGLVLPVGAALAFVAVSGRWRDVLRLEWPALLLLLLVVALPWYVQMYMRHGFPFFDRLILHDMVKRAFVHVHDTNKGDDVSFRYYIWQLGYGLFPWTGMCAAGLIWWAARREQLGQLKQETLLFLGAWWLVAFGMFSITLTKFHHYIFPLVPPTAALTGVLLADLMPRLAPGGMSRKLAYFAGVAVGTLLLWLGLVVCLPGPVNAVLLPDAGVPPGRPLLGSGFVLAGLALVVIASWKWVPTALPETAEGEPDEPGSPNAPQAGVPQSAEPQAREAAEQAAVRSVSKSLALAVVSIAAAGSVALVGRDLFVTRAGDVEGQVRLMHLFTYNYDRLFPKTLDFRGALLAFGILATLSCLLLVVQSIRRHVAVVLCSVAACFCVWCVDIYLVRLTPHWGQRETMVAYYQQRESDKDRLVAYQMNWKGENFYTGNRMATWVSSGAKFKEWIKKQREKGIKTMYFTTEHSRVATLKKELDNPKRFEVLTDETLNNKFFLARVVFDDLPQEPASEESNPKPSAAKSKKPAPPSAAQQADQ